MKHICSASDTYCRSFLPGCFSWFWRLEVQVKVSADLVSGDEPASWLVDATFSLAHMTFPWTVCRGRELSLRFGLRA